MLELPPLGLVACRIRVSRIVGKVKLGGRPVALALLAGDDQPGLLALPPGVEKLELSVRNPAPLRINLRRLRAVTLAHDLQQPLAGIDLVAEPLAQLAVAGGKVVLRNGIVAQRADGGGHGVAGRAKFLADGGKKKPRAVHGEARSCRSWRLGSAAGRKASRRPGTMIETTAAESVPLSSPPASLSGRPTPVILARELPLVKRRPWPSAPLWIRIVVGVHRSGDTTEIV